MDWSSDLHLMMITKIMGVMMFIMMLLHRSEIR